MRERVELVTLSDAAAHIFPALQVGFTACSLVFVVTFGDGARDEETFAPEGDQNILHMMNELVPRPLPTGFAVFCTICERESTRRTSKGSRSLDRKAWPFLSHIKLGTRDTMYTCTSGL
jgi:hypothetical protein